MRLFGIGLGCAGIAWGLIALPTFWQQSSIERIARYIIRGDPYRPEVLAAQLSIVQAAEAAEFCRPAGTRSAAIVRFRIAEQAIAEGIPSAIDSSLAELQAALRRSLACSPADPFLWLGLFWATSTHEGFKASHFNYLRLSYETGPNEGWIALKRNHVALALFRFLPEDLAERVIVEFLTMIKTGLHDAAGDNFLGPGRDAREVLLARMQELAENERRTIARNLAGKGFLDPRLPEGDTGNQRPWFR